ncbi:MAG: hypothetical protein KF824_12630 [Fimbriimonadaceae bacterium]|nr:MAG: hypothetical protein KF824_12630 [Fimbriimonadaceae bacterium]
MPKSNPKNPIQRNPRNPQSPTLSEGTGGGAPAEQATETVLLSLVNLNDAVLPNLTVNERVVIKQDENSILIATALGTVIGHVNSIDLEKMKGRRLKGARIFQVRLEPKQCVIEAKL